MRFLASNSKLFLIAMTVVLIAGLACTGSEPEPTPIPTSVPAEQIASIVKEAVNAASGPSANEIRAMVEAAGGPSADEIRAMVQAVGGPSADEMRSMVQDAVTRAVPEATDPAEIARMVEAAVAAGPGVTKAEVEAAMRAQAGDQMTADDVKKVVDAAIAAMPAPEVNADELRPLIEQSVAASVPEGTSAEEIRSMVQAAVTAATQGVPTQGQLETAISKAVGDASAGQLTAADVSKIVEASLNATAMASAQAAAARAGAAAVVSIAPPPSKTAPPVTDSARANPALLAKRAPNNLFTVNWDGPAPMSYSEAPLVSKWRQGGTLDRYGNTLPPVDERVGEPKVLAPTEAIGKYGGTWRRFYISPTDHGSPRTAQLGDWDSSGLGKEPHLLKDFTLSPDGRTVTYHLREGMKWSDGQPFTSEDFRFYYEDLVGNEEFSPSGPPSRLKSPRSKTPVKMTIPDQYTVIMEYEEPFYSFVDAGILNGWGTQAPDCWSYYAPAHYMKQFHPDYAEKAALDKMIADTEVENWVQLMKQKCNGYQNLEKPTTNAWIVIDGSEGPQWIFERNPYYNVVDTAGNQLPYLDYVVMTLVQDTEVGALKALAGEIDMQGRHMRSDKLPLLLEFQEVGGYRVHQYLSPSPADWGFWINQSYDEDPVIGDLLRKRDFRTALKISVDREELKEAVFAGSGEIRDYAPAEGSLFDVGPELRYYDIERDVDRANALLDGIGLTARDSDGYRLRPDGDGRITLRWDVYPQDVTPVEFIIQHWQDIGINSTFNVDPRQYVIHRANKGYLQPIAGGPGWNCWIAAHSCAPAVTASHIAVEVGRWYSTGGAQGEDPVSDKYKNEDGRYIMKELLDAYEEGFAHAMTSPRRKELATFLYKTYIEEALAINVIGSTSGFKGLFVVNDDMRNVPDPRTVVQGGFYNLPPRMELYYYENPEQHLHYAPR